ncbi:MAG TPA: phenylalanine--tRNA ligase subunit alpha [Thermoanaerobaculia bacterium]
MEAVGGPGRPALAIAELAALGDQFDQVCAAVRDRAAWEALRVQWVGRKQGTLRTLLDDIKRVEPSDRRAYGEAVNRLKERVEGRLAELDAALLAREREAESARQAIDVTLPGRQPPLGSLHPITLVSQQLQEIFAELGYSVAEGPEVEDDFHNFAALNFPPDHPARDTQDTFFLKSGQLLRTHTSPVQIRTMVERVAAGRKPPIRIICPGRVFRFDNDLRHSPMFHQVEALAVARGITLGHLKGTIAAFTRRLFKPDAGVRLRPSHFPFTEPSAEVDITCPFCDRKGCEVCSGTAWMEIMGCGMVDPRVLEGCGIDPDVYSGFAFGLGIDRVAMILYGVPNIRLLFENDERLLRQVPGL